MKTQAENQQNARQRNKRAIPARERRREMHMFDGSFYVYNFFSAFFGRRSNIQEHIEFSPWIVSRFT